ncbi:MAG: NAD(P)/FAD-dependent oxidoreductase [Methanoregula sp.]
MEKWECIVIGAGPAGLFCALRAATKGVRVLICEKNKEPGAKLLLAGSGQCNITHDGHIREFLTHYGDHGKFLKPALMSFTNQDLTDFFRERGLSLMTEENGKVFPETRRSADVLLILLAECKKQGVTIRCNEPVIAIDRAGGSFVVKSGGATYETAAVVITTGGASYPKCGTTGDGYNLASSLGQPVTDIGPALTPLQVRPFPFASLAGISFDQMHFTLWREGKKQGDYTGDVLFTHLGLSGPGILDASRDIRSGDLIRLSFAGPMRREEFFADLAKRAAENPGWQVSTILAKYPIPERLNRKLLKLSGIAEDLTCAHFSAAQRSLLVTNCTEFPLSVSEPGGFSIAMVTRGGIALDGVNQKTMESKIVPGLFFAGEVLDIDGDTGGYNLQAAFSTGHLAGLAIQKKRETEQTPSKKT